MQYTSGHNLRLPEDGDYYNVGDMNYNTAIIDSALETLRSGTVITDDTDLNDLLEAGVYYLPQNRTYTNMPTGVINGWLMVFNNINSVKQVLFRRGSATTQGNIYMRLLDGDGNEIGDWTRVLTENDLGNIQNFTTGALGGDYAEYFEWIDGNPHAEDRVGHFVTLDGEKIKYANAGDYILGIVSGMPAILGNNDVYSWTKKYVTDEFNRRLDFEQTYTDEKGNEHTYTGWKVSDEYNPEQQYQSRKERKEWDAIGMLGVLSVYDDGTCQVNGFCDVANGGIATAGSTYRVIARVSENIVKVIFR